MMQAPMHPAMSRRPDKSDKLEVCREFLRGICNRTEEECKFAHPPSDVLIDPMDGMVTVCMDFIKSRCSRDCCKFFHPPGHLQARVKANQLGSPLSSPVSTVQLLHENPHNNNFCHFCHSLTWQA